MRLLVAMLRLAIVSGLAALWVTLLSSHLKYHSKLEQDSYHRGLTESNKAPSQPRTVPEIMTDKNEGLFWFVQVSRPVTDYF